MNHIQVYDSMLSKEGCQHLIDYFESNVELLEPGLSGGEVCKECKDSFDLSIKLDNPRNEDEYKINELILQSLLIGTEKYCKKFKFLQAVDTWNVDNTFNIQRFDEGQGYHGIHSETMGILDSNRMLVWMIYLNNAKCGTRFYDPQRDIKAKQGRLVMWPPGWTYPHSGITPNKGKKYIVTGWFSYH